MALCDKCRICGNKNLIKIIDLGEHALTSVFPHINDSSPPKYPQILVKCDDTSINSEHCGLVQMMHTVSASELYTDNYGYRSGLNSSMCNHLKGICDHIESFVKFEKGDIIVDIGANDATLLSKYTCVDVSKIAIDPSGTQFKEYYPEDVKLVPKFFDIECFKTEIGVDKKAKVVTSISMFYDLPSPLQFALDVSAILEDDGVWVMEQSYMPSMIKNLSFDTICHEHLEYYTLKQIEYIASRSDLQIIDVSLNECNGGSFRVVLSKNSCTKYRVNTSNINIIKLQETESRWNTINPYTKFMKNVDLVRDCLVSFLKYQKSIGKTIAIYGASTKGNTLLQYFGIGNDIVSFIAERNPRKFGHKTPGTEIPILSEEVVRNMEPDYMLVLPWHFKHEFVTREKEYIDNGGIFVFPLPRIEFVCSGKKALIVGGSGQIGTYLSTNLITESYKVFDICRNPPLSTIENLIHIPCDATNTNKLEVFVKAVQPDEIYNLAAVTESNTSILDPIYTYEVNTLLVFHLLVIIKEIEKYRKIKFFQAGSTEIFRGNVSNVTVNEDSVRYFKPVTPYGTSKVDAFWAVKQSREFCGIHSITGIFSNVESRLRRNSYVTKKIVEYFVKGDFSEPLKLGNIKANCDWIHVRDAVDFICKIMHSDDIEASDYLICTGAKHSIVEFISEVASQLNMTIEWNEDFSKLNFEGKTLVEANHANMIRNFEKYADINYDNRKMKSIHLFRYSKLVQIVKDMIDGVRNT
jgi:GDP-mannose 4,6-dehydratase